MKNCYRFLVVRLLNYYKNKIAVTLVAVRISSIYYENHKKSVDTLYIYLSLFFLFYLFLYILLIINSSNSSKVHKKLVALRIRLFLKWYYFSSITTKFCSNY